MKKGKTSKRKINFNPNIQYVEPTISQETFKEYANEVKKDFNNTTLKMWHRKSRLQENKNYETSEQTQEMYEKIALNFKTLEQDKSNDDKDFEPEEIDDDNDYSKQLLDYEKAMEDINDEDNQSSSSSSNDEEMLIKTLDDKNKTSVITLANNGTNTTSVKQELSSTERLSDGATSVVKVKNNDDTAKLQPSKQKSIKREEHTLLCKLKTVSDMCNKRPLTAEIESRINDTLQQTKESLDIIEKLLPKVNSKLLKQNNDHIAKNNELRKKIKRDAFLSALRKKTGDLGAFILSVISGDTVFGNLCFDPIIALSKIKNFDEIEFPYCSEFKGHFCKKLLAAHIIENRVSSDNVVRFFKKDGEEISKLSSSDNKEVANAAKASDLLDITKARIAELNHDLIGSSFCSHKIYMSYLRRKMNNLRADIWKEIVDNANNKVAIDKQTISKRATNMQQYSMPQQTLKKQVSRRPLLPPPPPADIRQTRTYATRKKLQPSHTDNKQPQTISANQNSRSGKTARERRRAKLEAQKSWTELCQVPLANQVSKTNIENIIKQRMARKKKRCATMCCTM